MKNSKILNNTIAGLRYEEVQRLFNLYKGLGGKLPVTEENIQEFILKQRTTL